MLCLSKISVAKNSMDKKGVSRFSVQTLFCLTMPNSFAGESFCVVFQKFSVSQKDYGLESGRVSRFSVEKISLTMPKTFATESFCVVFQKTSGIEKDYG